MSGLRSPRRAPPAAPPEPAAQAPAKRPRGRPRKTEADRLADRERRLAAGSGQPSRRTKPVGVRILIPVDAYKRLTSDAIDMSCSAGDLVLSMVMDRWGRS